MDRVQPADRQRWACGRKTRPSRSTARSAWRASSRSTSRSATSWRPRAGAAWDVAGDGRWKVHGSWGVFYDIFKLSMPQAAFGGLRFTIYSFKLETYDWPSLVSSPDCPPACPGGQARAPVQFDPSFENIDPDLEPMRMQELTFGIEHQLSPHVAVSARFVHKQLDKAVEDIGSVDADGSATYVIGNPGYHRATEAIRRRALSQGRSRLRCRGARRAEAARPQLGAHRELRVEPPVRQLLGALGIRRERAHRAEHRLDLRRSAGAVRRRRSRRSTGGWRRTGRTRPRRS